jgi:hypothetical protein
LLFVFALDAPAVTAVTLFVFRNFPWTQLTFYAETPKFKIAAGDSIAAASSLKIR